MSDEQVKEKGPIKVNKHPLVHTKIAKMVIHPSIYKSIFRRLSGSVWVEA